MHRRRTRLLSVGMAIIVAMWTPLWCCCNAEAAQADLPAGKTAGAHLCHGSQSHATSEKQEAPSPGSHCPSDTPDDGCQHHQQMASAADDGFFAPFGLSVDLLPALKLLPAFTPLDVQQARRLVQGHLATASLLPAAGTLRAQHVLLLI